MNAFASECTSGCESGWTLYLEQSFLSPATTTSPRMVDIRIAGNFYGKKESNIVGDDIEEEEQQQEEDDLSMLSDASSGPPHFNEEDQTNYFNFFDQNIGGGGRKISRGKRRKERKSRRSHEKQEAVDDTASSPAFNFCKSNFGLPNNNPDYSQDFSATHFEGRSAYQAQFGYVQPSSLSGNQLHNNQWY